MSNMRGIDTPVRQRRRRVFKEVANLAYNSKNLKDDMEALPYQIVDYEESELWDIPPFNNNEGDFGYAGLKGLLNSSGWYDLAATSYASKISLEGQVEFYDWKIKDLIDSSTLIEQYAMTFDFLDLRVNEMIDRIANKVPSLKVLYDIGKNAKGEDADVLHGGICFYGGGKTIVK